MREMVARTFWLPLLLFAAGAGCDDCSRRTGGDDASGSTSATQAPAAAPSASTSAAALGPFVRKRPEQRTGVDACAYLGFTGFACLDALLEEKDPTLLSYMRRLSDADARLAFEATSKGERGGVAHAELALYCADEGPCKATRPDGAEMDDGYACLTKAEALRQEGKADEAARSHARACHCDPKRAQIPVMGGFLACDGSDQPVERAKELPLEEARDIRACGQCDLESGPDACARELARVGTTDAGLGRYLAEVHVPRCRKP
jgi:hypothetical protein